MKKHFLLLLLTFLSYNLFSQTSTWDGEAGTPNWEDNKNWSDDELPCTECHAVITDSVVLQTAQRVERVTLSNGNPTAILNVIETGKLEILSSDHSIHLANGSQLWNYGEIQIYGSTDNGIDMASNTYVYNKGTIQIEECTASGVSININSTFENRGTIFLKDCNNSGITIFNSQTAVLLNETSGEILCESNSPSGLQNNGKIQNFGIMNFIKTIGISIVNGRVFDNESSGTIEVDESQEVSIQNTHTFTNKGEIILRDSGYESIFNHSGTFTNSDNGSIEIYSAQKSGINVGSLSNSFLNTGSASILIDSTLIYGIDLSGSLENDASIKIINSQSSGIHNKDTLTNNGSIEIRKIDFTAIDNNTGSVQIQNGLTGTIYINHTYGILN